MVFFLALRNIARNKKNSAIVALLFALVTFLLFTGNSALGRAERGIKAAYVESLTGDVVVQKAGDVTMNLFGANTPVIDSYFTIPVLPAHDAVKELVLLEPGLAGLASQVSGRAYLDLLGVRKPALLCGVEPGSYFPLFPGIEVEEGRLLRDGEFGAMITAERAQRIERESGIRPAIGMPLLLTTGGAMGFRIREVPLVGVYRYKNPGQFMSEIVICDAQTVRALNSIQVAGAAVQVDMSAIFLLSADGDDMFSEAFGNSISEVFIANGFSGNVSDGVSPTVSEGAGFSVEMLRDFLREPEPGEAGSGEAGQGSGVPESGGDWNFILLRLDKGVSLAAFITSLNKKLEPYGLTAVNWRIASGDSAILSLLVQILFNAGIFLVSVAGVIAAINIILISVFRRTREIGSLRAIGASDAYIRSLVFSENLCIALAAGFAGVFGGMLFLMALNRMGLYIPNELIASMLGGPVLRVDFIPETAFFSFAAAIVMGLAASVYPVEAAVRIEPIVAVRRG